jgi:hypothetical protein
VLGEGGGGVGLDAGAPEEHRHRIGGVLPRLGEGGVVGGDGDP